MTSRNPIAVPGALAGAALLLASLASSSCARTVQDRSSRSAATPSTRRAPKTPKAAKIPKTRQMEAVMAAPSASRDTFARQIRNAVDAGEGDLRVRAWRDALAKNPDDVAARLALAKNYKEHNFPDVALEHYRMAATRFPDNAEVAVGLARSLDSLGQGVAARAGLQQFVSARPAASADAWSWLGILQDEARDYKGGEVSHRESLRLRDSSDAFHNNLGYNLLLQGRAPDSTAEFRRAVALAPASSLAKNNLAMAMAADPSLALSELRLVAEPATAHSNLAAILIERGELDQARMQLQAALRYQKDHPAALSNLQLLASLEGGSVTLSHDGSPKTPWQRVLDVLFGSKYETRGRNTADSTGRNDRSASPGSGSN
ncbi:MAG: hypothetical protein SGI92_29700 [Bryobacteraceae bacterium]|nr:hypothetical protein [Bryobacteraceae bacterium]